MRWYLNKRNHKNIHKGIILPLFTSFSLLRIGQGFPLSLTKSDTAGTVPTTTSHFSSQFHSHHQYSYSLNCNNLEAIYSGSCRSYKLPSLYPIKRINRSFHRFCLRSSVSNNIQPYLFRKQSIQEIYKMSTRTTRSRAKAASASSADDEVKNKTEKVSAKSETLDSTLNQKDKTKQKKTASTKAKIKSPTGKKNTAKRKKSQGSSESPEKAAKKTKTPAKASSKKSKKPKVEPQRLTEKEPLPKLWDEIKAMEENGSYSKFFHLFILHLSRVFLMQWIRVVLYIILSYIMSHFISTLYASQHMNINSI